MKHSRVGGGSPLCTTTTFGYLSDAGEEPCPRCELLVATLKTNAGAYASRRPPFRSDYFGRWTQGAKFYASAILGQVHDSALYNRWTAARTFEHLQAFVAAGRGQPFVGCVDCGAKPHPTSTECPVCGRHAPPPVRTESNEHP